MAKKQARPLNGGAVIIDDGGPGKIEIAGQQIGGVKIPRVTTKKYSAKGLDAPHKNAFVKLVPKWVVVDNDGKIWKAPASDVRSFQVFASFETIKGAIFDQRGVYLRGEHTVQGGQTGIRI